MLTYARHSAYSSCVKLRGHERIESQSTRCFARAAFNAFLTLFQTLLGRCLGVFDDRFLMLKTTLLSVVLCHLETLLKLAHVQLTPTLQSPACNATNAGSTYSHNQNLKIDNGLHRAALPKQVVQCFALAFNRQNAW